MLKHKQGVALTELKKGRNVFLTGEAGTGKSYVIEEFISYAKGKDKNVLVVAPTGLAALNIGGVTIHRTFKAPIGAILHHPMQIPEEVEKADIIIVDEISMCRRDLFTWVARIILKASQRKGKGIQFVVVGDFLQLPPVLTEKDNKILKYTTPGYAFEAKEWEIFDFVTISLSEVVRQADLEFVTNLNKARIGDKSCLDWINHNHNKKEQEKAIYLCGTNKQADQINKDSLDALKSKEWEFKANETGTVTEQDRPAPRILKLKEGARVMSVINTEKYVNGSLGTITKIKRNMIEIDFDEAGIQQVSKHEWSINEYQFNEETGKVSKREIGTYEQFPFKLAYAITIHKSQGQTYDAVNLYPYSFAPGQLYVALSRCKSIDKLHLMSQINSSSLITSEDVLTFYANNIEANNVSASDQKSEATEPETTANRGGKREGAGRKQKYKCKTVTMRVPENMVDKIKAFIQQELMQEQDKDC